jgi:hypothetical protein
MDVASIFTTRQFLNNQSDSKFLRGHQAGTNTRRVKDRGGLEGANVMQSRGGVEKAEKGGECVCGGR